MLFTAVAFWGKHENCKCNICEKECNRKLYWYILDMYELAGTLRVIKANKANKEGSAKSKYF
jgi:hypothetical protein